MPLRSRACVNWADAERILPWFNRHLGELGDILFLSFSTHCLSNHTNAPVSYTLQMTNFVKILVNRPALGAFSSSLRRVRGTINCRITKKYNNYSYIQYNFHIWDTHMGHICLFQTILWFVYSQITSKIFLTCLRVVCGR